MTPSPRRTITSPLSARWLALRAAAAALPCALAMVACTGDDPALVAGDRDASVDGDALPGDGAADGATDPTGEHDGHAPDGATGSDGGPTLGDVLYLTGATLVAAAPDSALVGEWRNGVAAHASLVARPTGAAVPSIFPNADAAKRCVAFNGAHNPLAIAAAPALDVGLDDFSLTVVVKRSRTLVAADFGRVVVARNLTAVPAPDPLYAYRGFALVTEYQDGDRTAQSKALKYAARLDYPAAGGSPFEVVESAILPDQRDVVSMYRRGAQLFLRVGATVYGPRAGADSYAISSPTRPLTLGQSDDDADPATRYDGQLCAVVLHHGPESDVELAARIDALAAAYPP